MNSSQLPLRLPRCGFVVALVAAVATFASTASAAVPSLEQHRSTSASNSLSKSTTVACPAGMNLTGVGGDITGGAGAVLIDDLTPNSTRIQNTTLAYEINPFTASWYLHSYAMCARPLAGATRVAATSPSTSANKSVGASCPAGTQLTGAAGQVDGAFGQVTMDDLTANGSPATSVTVTGNEVDAFPNNWTVTAYALCANPLPGLERRVVTSASNSVNKSATATCTAGKKVIGLGGTLTGAGGEVVVDRYTPHELLTSVTVTGSEAVDDDGAFAGNWTVTAYAICATP